MRGEPGGHSHAIADSINRKYNTEKYKGGENDNKDDDDHRDNNRDADQMTCQVKEEILGGDVNREDVKLMWYSKRNHTHHLRGFIIKDVITVLHTYFQWTVSLVLVNHTLDPARWVTGSSSAIDHIFR